MTAKPHDTFIASMPKAELHVHLEGSVQPETLLALAKRNSIELPATDVAGLQEWFLFRDFDHFIEIYKKLSTCIRTPEDLELIMHDFMRGQAEQNIRYTELTWTPYTHFENAAIPFADQLEALNSARAHAESEWGVLARYIPDYSRDIRPLENATTVAQWAVEGAADGVVALGLGGPELGNPPRLFEDAYAVALAADLASVPHQGETDDATSIRDAIELLGAVRIGHGIRCLDDESVVRLIRDRNVTLDVCPTSNVCLGVVPSMEQHPLPRLMDAGISVTIASDDPALFSTTLTDEYRAASIWFGLDEQALADLSINAVRTSLLPHEERTELERAFTAEFDSL